MPEETVKCTFALTLTTKYRLASAKARLRRKGVIATESGLVEALLSSANIQALEEALTCSLG